MIYVDMPRYAEDTYVFDFYEALRDLLARRADELPLPGGGLAGGALDDAGTLS